MRDRLEEIAFALAVVVALAALAVPILGCSVRSRRPCCEPCPGPTPAPSPHPTPAPTPAPSPPPPQATCPKIVGGYNCNETGPQDYTEAVRNAFMRLTGGRTETHYPLLIQQQLILQAMVDLNASGYCTSYDLQAGNAGAQASEMGIRLRSGGDHNEWNQPIASNGYIRWDGMYRSTCYPLADEEMVEEVAAYWSLPVPPPFGPGPLMGRRRPGGPAR